MSSIVSTFAGTAMLPKNTAAYHEDPELHTEQDLTPQSYLHHMSSLATQEASATFYDNEKYALYNAVLAPSPAHHVEDQIWALLVPGLREGRPFLEPGDILQLRQLHMDSNGHMLPFAVPFEDIERRPDHPGVIVGWTGRQLNAYVDGVNKASELVYLKVDGLIPLYSGQAQSPPFVNVTFPVKLPQLQVQQKARVAIGTNLIKTSPPALFARSTIEHEKAPQDLHAGYREQGKPSGTSTYQTATHHNDWIRRMLFPTEEDGLLQTRLRRVPHSDFFDHAINYEQAHAVKSICVDDYGVLPYLISGPPGTGKTKTLVETAMQLLHTSKNTHIIMCAPSEAAADTLALRLKQYLSTDELLRLNRPGRVSYEMPMELTQYGYMNKNKFDLPPIRQLLSYNIIVTSCQDAGILHEARLANNDLWHIEKNTFTTFHPEDNAPPPTLHWSALLIDEAAQATEMDILPALNVVCPPSEHPKTSAQPLLVMAGDEHQLGPRTASSDPESSTSLFARLSQRSLYKSHPLARDQSKPSTSPPVLEKSMLPIIYPPFTNLIRNYRSHPAILTVPSSLFYNDTLIPEAPTPESPLQHSSIWCGRAWPVLFVPHSAPDEIERDGGGWYNLSEARIACSIAQELVRCSGVQQADICIMSPFAAQVKLLRKIMRSNGYGLWDVNIGPVEAFQGLEKRVVIICTTRTREKFLEQDRKRGLGIVKQPRTMNVALTRAKEALIVLGNPALLKQDRHWRAWLAFCWRNGLVAGNWDVKEKEFGEQKIGVLERALIVRAENRKKKLRTLGAGTETFDVDPDRRYEVWTESLREALEEEDEELEDEETEDEDEDEDEEDDDDANVL
ncbi:P-loop containing nucleoside triphosphate hydrolase protein [Phaeosphaeria sp. MPI-PUGE-AT-0046c]|nr:P-loop containing nucleoside triphosphate hydrolase protein [Phaeosphaeria sp. MPI-PUGE-AT-0046c]